MIDLVEHTAGQLSRRQPLRCDACGSLVCSDHLSLLDDDFFKQVTAVMAASSIVTANLHLDQERMIERSKQKIALFTYWQGGGKDPKLPEVKNAL